MANVQPHGGYREPAAHTPVMLGEVLEWLAPRPGARIVDATVGLGGHAAAILERLGDTGCLIGIDQDPAALELADQRLSAVVLTLRAGEQGSGGETGRRGDG